MISYYKRLVIWDWILKKVKHPQEKKLSWMLRRIYNVLFPLLSFYWYMSKSNGYQLYKNVWFIHGKKYSDEFFRNFAISNNDFKMVNSNDFKIIEEKQKEKQNEV
jgi:hypothetical protein